MSVLEPGEAPELQFPEDEESPVAVLPEPLLPVEPAYRNVCATCKRGIVEVENKWVHWDPRVDHPSSPCFHAAELFVEPPTAWGHLDTKGKSLFQVDQGPSKVRSGWSGGGVK